MNEIVAGSGKDEMAGQTVYRCGTLTYTKIGLMTLFLWLLWGDFCFTLMTQLTPTLLPLMLKRHELSNTTIGLLAGSIPAILNFVLNPIISTASDRTRTRWGRRIPYMLFSAPFLAAFLILVGWGNEIGLWFYRIAFGNGDGDGGNPELVIVTVIMIFAVGYQLFYLFTGCVFYYIFADVVPTAFVGRFTSFFRVAGTVAGFLFSKYAIPLAEFHIQWVFTVIALFYLVAYGMVCLRVKEGKYPPPEPYQDRSVGGVVRLYLRQCFSIPIYPLLFIALAINNASMLCRAMFNMFFATEDLGVSMEQYGNVGAACALLSLFLYIPLGYVIDRWHPLRVFMVGGFAIVAVNVWGFFCCVDYESFYWISLVMNIPYVLQAARVLPLMIKIYPTARFGQFSSACAMVMSIVTIIANYGGGMFIDAFGYRYIFVWDFLFTLFADLLLVVIYFLWKGYGGDADYVAPERNA